MIHWVFGGSAVGKKRFINCAMENTSRFWFAPDLRREWYEDGEMDPDTLALLASLSPIIVRWQWGRENVMTAIIEKYPVIQHEIVVCKVMPSVQVRRVIQREGALKWDERGLIRECEDVDWLVQRLSMNYRLPVRYIDATDEYEKIPRVQP